MNRKIGHGSLRAVEAKTEAHPGYKGSVQIGDQKYWLAGWKKIGDDGKPFLSLSLEVADPPAEQAKPIKPAMSYAPRRNPVDGF
jgi:uncharacterized protein (DUF736 family)